MALDAQAARKPGQIGFVDGQRHHPERTALRQPVTGSHAGPLPSALPGRSTGDEVSLPTGAPLFYPNLLSDGYCKGRAPAKAA